MSDLPRAYPVPAEAWTGPDEDERPVRQRVVSAVSSALVFPLVVALGILVPAALPWVIGAGVVWTAISIVVVVTRALRRRRSARRNRRTDVT